MAVLQEPEVAAREVLLNLSSVKASLFLLFFILMTPHINAQQSIDELLEKNNSGEIPYISVEELRMYQLDSNVVILDARESEEYEVSHIKNATFVGYNEFDISGLTEYPKEKRIVVYCSLGVRSEKIGNKLQKAGFENVWNLYGGIFSWKIKGYEVVNMAGEETEKVHAYSKQWSKWLDNAEKIY
ncbi:MAG: rhodanese-like domain-containing protein [Christiangramia sp.]|nr:rhodanese-like domain-containing protein [Christiangramia sp.]